jgi:spore germination cell wall hydrolase CwlJ-like protein
MVPDADRREWERAWWVASGMLSGYLPALQRDPTKGAAHYYAKGSKVPAWAVGLVPSAEVGGHLFFVGVQ